MELNWKGRYSYDETTVKKNVMNKSGNYMILVKQKNENYRPVYVGKTVDLEQRLLEHLSNSESNPCLKKHVKEHILGMRYCYVYSETDRQNVEYSLYKNYSHECNQNKPDGKEVSITSPY